MTSNQPTPARPPDASRRARALTALVALTAGLLLLLWIVSLTSRGPEIAEGSPSATPRSPSATGTAAPDGTPRSSPSPPPSPPSVLPPNLLGVDIASLPTRGPAWENVVEWADQDIDSPSLAKQSDDDNVRTLAAALVYARTGDAAYREKVLSALEEIRGTEEGRTLALARELGAYVISADLVDYDDASFDEWLTEVIAKRMDDDRSLVEMVGEQGNNWGTHGQATLAAVYGFLGDRAGLEEVARIVRGFTGDQTAWDGWTFNNSTDWAAGTAPINPPGATIQGHDVSGVIHQDQIRGGKFEWPPPAENYVWEALQGLTLATELLSVQGYPAWSWGDNAALRTVTWLHEEADFPAEGDDEWVPFLVNARTGSQFPATSPARPGKGFGFADWLYGSGT